VTTDEPALTRAVVRAIEFQRKQVFQATIDFLPPVKPAPTDNEMPVRWIKACGFESPIFFLTDGICEEQELFLGFVIEDHRVLLCVLVVLSRTFCARYPFPFSVYPRG
jgi:hypothetical protein